MKLYVGNLPYKVKDQDLTDLFSQAGQVSEAIVLMDKMTGRSKGFGFVTFENDAEAQKAIEMFDGYQWEGRPLRVNEAKPFEPRPRNNGFRSRDNQF